MDQTRLDSLVRRLAETTTRRHALRTLAAGALGLLGGTPGGAWAAEGCLSEGKPCERGKQCCSGLCKGKKGKKACRRVPSQGICTNRMKICDGSSPHPDCGAGPLDCRCNTTLTGRAFCGSSLDTNAGITPCASDLECAQQFGNGAVCVRGAGVGPCTIDFCQLPCPDPVRP